VRVWRSHRRQRPSSIALASACLRAAASPVALVAEFRRRAWRVGPLRLSL